MWQFDVFFSHQILTTTGLVCYKTSFHICEAALLVEAIEASLYEARASSDASLTSEVPPEGRSADGFFGQGKLPPPPKK